MLPGTEKLRNAFMADVQKYAKEHDVHPIYIGMAGSRSKGMDSADSDYDTRVLYVPACRDGRMIHYPWLEDEKSLHQKFYTNEKSDLSGKPWEFIPFWEATSFFQFLKCPKFRDCNESSGLYKIVGWTMKTPYSWDPYGLQQKIVPLIDSIFVPHREVGWYKEQIKYYWKKADDVILMKYYLKALHAALSIAWMRDCYGCPPVDKYVLMYGNPTVSADFQNELLRFMDSYRAKSLEYITAHPDGHLYESHLVMESSKNSIFESFIEECYSYEVPCIPITEKRIDDVLKSIYEIIWRSMEEAKSPIEDN